MPWVLGDIVDGAAVMVASQGHDAIIHLAGILTPDCKTNPVRGAQINLIGTLSVFQAARQHGIDRLLYTSSAGVYGPDDGHVPGRPLIPPVKSFDRGWRRPHMTERG